MRLYLTHFDSIFIFRVIFSISNIFWMINKSIFITCYVFTFIFIKVFISFVNISSKPQGEIMKSVYFQCYNMDIRFIVRKNLIICSSLKPVVRPFVRSSSAVLQIHLFVPSFQPEHGTLLNINKICNRCYIHIGSNG